MFSFCKEKSFLGVQGGYIRKSIAFPDSFAVITNSCAFNSRINVKVPVEEFIHFSSAVGWALNKMLDSEQVIKTSLFTDFFLLSFSSFNFSPLNVEQ